MVRINGEERRNKRKLKLDWQLKSICL